MIFTKEKIEELEKSELFKLGNINKSEINILFKKINKIFKNTDEFLANIEDQKFNYRNTRLVCKYKSSLFAISKNHEQGKDYILPEHINILKDMKSFTIKKWFEAGNTVTNNFDISSEIEEYLSRSDFSLDCSGMKLFFSKGGKLSITFSTAIINQIDKSIEFDKTTRNKKERDDFINFKNVFSAILKINITEELNKYKEKIQLTCQEMYELKKIKSKILRSFNSEERTKANEIFSNYDFSYNRKNKKDTIKEIQDLIMLTSDSKRNVRLGKLDKITNDSRKI